MDFTRKIVIKEIERLLRAKDYRIVTQTEINTKFLTYCLDFFKKVVETKINGTTITEDWYKDNFVMNNSHKPVDRAIYAGINKKTITNMFNSGTKEIVVSASEDNYDTLVNSISHLIEENDSIDLKLTIKLNSVSVEFYLNESLIVITSLAVKRAAITGGAYSAIGKNVEGPLMLTLCKLYKVPTENYNINIEGGGTASYGDFEREVDFFLSNNGTNYKCEVKLMGKGNPEVADAVIARESKVFIADKLSDTNKNQLDSLNISWVELRAEEGFKRFKNVLEKLEIPYTDYSGNLDEDLEVIFDEILA
ncbi:MAG: CfrBI family restriction endonuclease [Chitinophagales bacterium]|nr:CfrBI family restriction endonuclease [Bacteroidota bacterium]MCB9042835.1 CfrBI family restriction endonuclease [Chitinophagales bacterium]